ncbi:MAG: sugar porter family MFS transporter [Lutibacter sp.]|nr:sugar porter family MFS transporter [Lutibacter sp.]
MNKPYTITISFIVALGGFLLGFDSAVISGAVNGISHYFSMNDWELGFSVGCVIFGAMFGNIVAGPLSDRFGRKSVLLITAVLFTVSALWSATATSYLSFVIARIIGGIGIGGAILIAPIYIAEVAPPKLRGSLVSLNQLNIVLGISVAYFSNYFLIDISAESWRWMLGVEALPAFLYFVALFIVPKSPRWLIQKLNNTQLAEKTLVKIGGKSFADETIKEILGGMSKKQEKGSYASFFSPKMTTILIIAFGLAFFQQITGINAIFYYAPSIFEQAGGSTDSALLQAIVVGLTNLIFTLVAIRLIDRLGRKPLLIIGTAAMTLALSLATLAFSNATYHLTANPIAQVEDAEVKAALTTLETASYDSQEALFTALQPLVTSDQLLAFKRNEVKKFISIDANLVLLAILLYVAAFAISLGPVMWTMLSEIFPGNVKGIAISAVGFFNSLVSYTVTQFFPWELTNLGPTLTFAIYAAMALLSLLFVVKFVVETKGKTLEELEAILIRP